MMALEGGDDCNDVCCGESDNEVFGVGGGELDDGGDVRNVCSDESDSESGDVYGGGGDDVPDSCFGVLR